MTPIRFVCACEKGHLQDINWKWVVHGNEPCQEPMWIEEKNTSADPADIGKWLELLSEIAPGLKRAAIMFNLDTTPVSTTSYMPSFETAARSLKVVPITAPVHNDIEIDTAITALGREPGGGFVALSGAFLRAHRALIILAAARNNVPAVYNSSAYARDGGLLSYGPDGVDTFRRAASYVDRILRGAKPAELQLNGKDLRSPPWASESGPVRHAGASSAGIVFNRTHRRKRRHRLRARLSVWLCDPLA